MTSVLKDDSTVKLLSKLDLTAGISAV